MRALARLLRRTGFFCWMTRVIARQLLLVRHGCVAPEFSGRYVGSTDCDLDSRATGELQTLAALLEPLRPAKCLHSPLLRACRTAEILCATLGVDSQADDDLREIDFGLWEGLTFDEIASDWPAEVEAWARFAADFTFPGGQCVADFLAQIGRAAERLTVDPAETVMAVAHGGVIKSMICRFLGLEPWQYVLFAVPYATCVVIDLQDGRGVLAGLGLTGLKEEC